MGSGNSELCWGKKKDYSHTNNISCVLRFSDTHVPGLELDTLQRAFPALGSLSCLLRLDQRCNMCQEELPRRGKTDLSRAPVPSVGWTLSQPRDITGLHSSGPGMFPLYSVTHSLGGSPEICPGPF